MYIDQLLGSQSEASDPRGCILNICEHHQTAPTNMGSDDRYYYVFRAIYFIIY